MIKVFISFKKEDSNEALRVAQILTGLGILNQVAELDRRLSGTGEELGDYFRENLRGCSHLMAIVSRETRLAWWVPFEIGIATERQHAITTYVVGPCVLPDYLKKWPYLTSYSDITTFKNVATTTEVETMEKGFTTLEPTERGVYSRAFHRKMKEALRH